MVGRMGTLTKIPRRKSHGRLRFTSGRWGNRVLDDTGACAAAVGTGGHSWRATGPDRAIVELHLRCDCSWLLLRSDVPPDAFETSHTVPHARKVSRFADGRRDWGYDDREGRYPSSDCS